MRRVQGRGHRPDLDAERSGDLAVFEVGVVPHEHHEPLTLRQHGEPKAQLVIAGLDAAILAVVGSKLNSRPAPRLARTVQDAAPHPAYERPAALPLARIAQRVCKALLNSVERR